MNKGAFYSRKSVESQQFSDSDRRALGQFLSCHKGEEKININLQSDFILLDQ